MSPSGSPSESGDSASPKRFKANDFSTLPASILKEDPSDEEISDDRSERRKSRKSIGRRVSFAPTAHVRMFEIPEEKQRDAQGNNMYQTPDLSSQTGMLDFNLGPLSTVEETSMASNESFDVSVRHSDPSDSLHSSEGSFATPLDAADGRPVAKSLEDDQDGDQGYGNILDEDDDDDLDDIDADDDAVTMELTGTVDMGAIGNDDDSDTGRIDEEETDEPVPSNSADNMMGQAAHTVDADIFLSMLMQSDVGDANSSGSNTTDQQTSLLENIMSQLSQGQLFTGSDNTIYGSAEADITRVGITANNDDQDTTVRLSASAGTADESEASDYSNDDASNENDDAVTMELTGIVSRLQPDRDSADELEDSTPPVTSYQENPFTATQAIDAASSIWSPPMVSSFMDTIQSLISTQQPEVQPIGNILPNSVALSTLTPAPIIHEESVRTPARKPMAAPSTPKSAVSTTPRSVRTPRQITTPKPIATPRSQTRARTPAARSTPRQPSATPTPGRRAQKAPKFSTPATPVPTKEPGFVLDSLPPVPALSRPPTAGVTFGPPSLADQAKAGLVLNVFNAYHQQRLVPEPATGIEQQSEYPAKFEPLYRKAQLTARLEYCSALNSLFEADRAVSDTATIEPVQFESVVSFFNDQNDLLAQRKDELLLRISRAKQKLAAEAPSSEAGSTSNEILSLRGSLSSIRAEREAMNSKIEHLNAEIQTLQATCTTFDRQVTEKKSAQSILLAINGLQPAGATAETCDFIYDKFTKLHFGESAEFTSLHPEIDWSAVIRSSIDAEDLTMRQYTIAVMKANVVLKDLLEDVRKVKLHTFVEIQYNDGIQVRMQFFSRKQRRRFHLQIPLSTVESYARLHEETSFEWPADVVYGDLDIGKLKRCLRSCHISSSAPVLSIYQHVDSSMEAF
ncbi:hypothetical protein IW147_002002 [Coemansia sp. RSA 720]|nr:hypothetical protein IW147_002002 [Coemansia sp. RSA 720]